MSRAGRAGYALGMTITLEGEAAEALQQAAHRAGYGDVAAYVRDRLAPPPDERPRPTREEVDEWLDRMTGAADTDMTTDELMLMLRGEDDGV